MIKFYVSYNIAGRPGRGISIEQEQGEPSFHSVAQAILAYEFAEVDAPFGVGGRIKPADALRQFAITDVSMWIAEDD